MIYDIDYTISFILAGASVVLFSFFVGSMMLDKQPLRKWIVVIIPDILFIGYLCLIYFKL